MPSDSLRIESRAVEPFLKNGYVVSCAATGHASYIDPGDEASLLLQWIDVNDLELISIINTHGHMDHVCGVKTVKEKWDVPIYLHQEDEFLYNALSEQANWFGLSYPPAPPIDYYLHPTQQLSIGDLTIQVLHTPGHSPGSVSLLIEEEVFCGDLIFAGSIGRTDLPKGSHQVLLESVRDQILPLGDERVLYPGHGPQTTIGQERLMNPFLQGL
jgi:glyoxylase-like metal-dependent hydrolase (beta-lactamase superfamily II)